MDRRQGVDPDVPSSSYYSVLGIRRDASSSQIRSAYRNLAMKWHPDKWSGKPAMAGEAQRRFQLVQEAYSVLSHDVKRSMYDAGIYDPFEDDNEEFCDFMEEMMSMMDNVKAEGESLEDLQRAFLEMVDGFDLIDNLTATKTASVTTSKGNAAKSNNSR